MRSVFLIACSAVSLAFSQPAPAGPEGRWRTIDDKTGRVKSIVRIARAGDALEGRIERLFRLPEEVQDPVCKACEGERKDKRIVGMTIMWGLRPAKEGWDGGFVLDPQNGKIYRCKLSVSPDGQSLTVRGYLGISLLGRSQTWKRVGEEEGSGPAPSP